MSYSSETKSCRTRLAPFCVGNGLDLGFGGDPILPTAICIDRAPMDGSRAQCGESPTHIVGDVANLYWFNDVSMDYVYSSHVLEDFENTETIIREWWRVVKINGRLVLFLPDQKAYVQYCKEHGADPNQAHKHPDFSIDFVKARLPGDAEIIYEEYPFEGNPYSFALVLRKKQ